MPVLWFNEKPRSSSSSVSEPFGRRQGRQPHYPVHKLSFIGSHLIQPARATEPCRTNRTDNQIRDWHSTPPQPTSAVPGSLQGMDKPRRDGRNTQEGFA